MSDHSGANAGMRRVSAGLAIGIFLLPIVFVWFTLRDGYTKSARAIAFGWLIISALLGILSAAQPQDETQAIAEAPIDGEDIEAEEKEVPAAPPAGPASTLALVSAHRWSTWDSPCSGPLQATYTPKQGQMIFRNGQLLQDSNKSNITYEFTENSDGSFTYDQVSTDQSLPDVVVTVMRERIYIESENEIRIERVTVSLSDEAMNDFSIMIANPNDHPELYKVEKKTVYESRCS